MSETAAIRQLTEQTVGILRSFTADSIAIQVYRHGDTAALYCGTDVCGGLVYLIPKEARKVARALNAVARNIEAQTLARSLYRTFALVRPAQLYGMAGKDYAYDRPDVYAESMR